MNAGERDELLTVIRLVQMRDAQMPLLGLNQINTVGFDTIHYISPPWPYSIGIPPITDQDLSHVSAHMGLCKAGSRSKADVFVNGIRLSLKSSKNAPPAIVNHTTRPGWQRICKIVGVDICELDRIVDDYWSKRISGAIKEDTRTSNPACPFYRYEHLMKPLLEYFLFEGTGANDSTHPADFILEFDNPRDETSWRLLDPATAFSELWPYLVFSIRSKGMPRAYPEPRDMDNLNSIDRWTKYHQGKHRGALHVRVDKR